MQTTAAAPERPRSFKWNETTRHYWAMLRTPPDPVWANSEQLEVARESLREYDPYLALWWSRARRGSSRSCPGRWRVVRYKPGGGFNTVFYLEGPTGEYRDPEPIAPILAQLKKADVGLDHVVRTIEAANANLLAKQKAERMDWVRRGILETHARFMRGRRVFGVAKIE